MADLPDITFTSFSVTRTPDIGGLKLTPGTKVYFGKNLGVDSLLGVIGVDGTLRSTVDQEEVAVAELVAITTELGRRMGADQGVWAEVVDNGPYGGESTR